MSDRKADRYIRPPLLAREPAPRWHAVWRFRLGALVIALLLAWVVAVLVGKYLINTEQDPGFGTAPAPAGVPAPLR